MQAHTVQKQDADADAMQARTVWRRRIRGRAPVGGPRKRTPVKERSWKGAGGGGSIPRTYRTYTPSPRALGRRHMEHWVHSPTVQAVAVRTRVSCDSLAVLAQAGLVVVVLWFVTVSATHIRYCDQWGTDHQPPSLGACSGQPSQTADAFEAAQQVAGEALSLGIACLTMVWRRPASR